MTDLAYNLPPTEMWMWIWVRRIKRLLGQPRGFLMNLSKIKDINPLPKTLCSEAEEVAGIGSTANGGVPAYGSLAYIKC